MGEQKGSREGASKDEGAQEEQGEADGRNGLS